MPALQRAALPFAARRVASSARRSRMSACAAANAASTANVAANAGRKVVHLLRHGQTEMNVYLSMHRYDSSAFHDPLLYDTRLTPEGEKQAKAANKRVNKLNPPPEIIISSPLTRAMRTAELAFEGVDGVPRLVSHLARERLWHSSDVGRVPEEVAADFPAWTGFDALPRIWWHNNGDGDPLAFEPEPEAVFLPRIEQLRQWLDARPEKSIALVAHWGVIEALTSSEFENCELRSYYMDQIHVRAAREPAPVVPG